MPTIPDRLYRDKDTGELKERIDDLIPSDGKTAFVHVYTISTCDGQPGSKPAQVEVRATVNGNGGEK